MAFSLAQKIGQHTKRSLRRLLQGSIRIEDLATEYPLQWMEDLKVASDTATLADGPGLGDMAVSVYQDLSMAAGIEYSCADPYYATDAYLEGVKEAIAGVLSQIEYDEQIQFYWTTWNEAKLLLDQFGSLRSDDPLFLKWWRSNRKKRESRRFADGSMRLYRSFLFLNKHPGKNVLLDPFQTYSPSPLATVSRLASILPQTTDGYDRSQYEAMMASLGRRVSNIRSMLTDGKLIDASLLQSRDLFTLLRRNWAPTRFAADQAGKGYWAHTIPQMDHRSAPFPAYFLLEEVEDGGSFFTVGDTHHTILTMRTLPDVAEVGALTLAMSSGDAMRDISQVECTLVLKPAAKDQEMAKLRRKITILQGMANSGPQYSDYQTLVQQYKDRLSELRKATKPAMFEAHLQVHLWNKDPGKLTDWSERIISATDRACGIVLELEERQAFPYYIGYGQPGYTRYNDPHRAMSVVPIEASVLAPVAVNSMGCLDKEPGSPVPLLVETDLGTPYGIDLFPLGKLSNFGGMGIGGSGSGKSNYYQQLVLAYANRNSNIVIFDGADQPSFRYLCTLLGGRYYDFSSGMTFNPLSTKVINGVQQNPTDDEMTKIMVVLAAMFRGTAAKLTPLEVSILTSAIRFAFEQRKDPNKVILEHLVPGLNPNRFNDDDSKQTASEFGRVLKETWLARYGQLLNGADKFAPHWFSVFDLRDLFRPGQEQLQPVIVAILFRHLDQMTYASLGKPLSEMRRTLVLIDEAWKPLMNPLLLGEILTIYRTGRARWVSCHLLSQNIEDVTNLLEMSSDGANKSGRKYESSPLINCSSHFFLFKMSQSEAKKAGETFELTQQQIDKLKSLDFRQNEYRNFVHYLRVADNKPNAFTCLRSRLLPEEIWATSSSASDNGKRQEMRIKLQESCHRDPEAKKRLLVELQKAGWDLPDDTSLETVLDYGVIHLLAHNLTLK